MSISSMFYVPVFCQYFGAKKLQSQCFSFVILGDKISYKKQARKTLMKLTADVIILLKFNAKLRKTNFVCSIFEIQRVKKGKIKMKILRKETNIKKWFKKMKQILPF